MNISKLPEEVKLRGVMSFAHFPPANGDFLVSRLWDQLMGPGWRGYAANPPMIGTKEEQSNILSKLNEISDAPGMEDAPEFSMESADSVTIKRSVPLYRGKWRMLPPEVEKTRDAKKKRPFSELRLDNVTLAKCGLRPVLNRSIPFNLRAQAGLSLTSNIRLGPQRRGPKSRAF